MTGSWVTRGFPSQWGPKAYQSSPIPQKRQYSTNYCRKCKNAGKEPKATDPTSKLPRSKSDRPPMCCTTHHIGGRSDHPCVCHKGPILQPRASKRSPVTIVVPTTITHPQRTCWATRKGPKPLWAFLLQCKIWWPIPIFIRIWEDCQEQLDKVIINLFQISSSSFGCSR